MPSASEPGIWSVQANVYNHHYHPDARHLSYSPLLGIERRAPSGWLAGGALFLNSFGQFSQLVYGGYAVDIPHTPFYGKIAAGILHGYDGQYRDKVPFNFHGFSPGIIPAIGYRYGPFRAELQLLWTNGFMVTAGMAF